MIRDQLYIKKNIRDINPYSSRKGYMDKSFRAGRRFPSLNYAAFANSMELRLNAKMRFFKRNHFHYSGWGMDKNWDHKLKAEEQEQKDKGNKAYQIGHTLGERLLQASLRELSYELNEPRLRKCLPKDKPDDPPTIVSKSEPGKQGKKMQVPKDKPEDPPTITSKSLSELGKQGKKMQVPKDKPDDPPTIASKSELGKQGKKRQVPKDKPEDPPTIATKPEPEKQGKKTQAKVNHKRDDKEKKCWRYKDDKLYLPIIFQWEKMKTTKGYPQLKVNNKHVC